MTVILYALHFALVWIAEKRVFVYDAMNALLHLLNPFESACVFVWISCNFTLFYTMRFGWFLILPFSAFSVRIIHRLTISCRQPQENPLLKPPPHTAPIPSFLLPDVRRIEIACDWQTMQLQSTGVTTYIYIYHTTVRQQAIKRDSASEEKTYTYHVYMYIYIYI